MNQNLLKLAQTAILLALIVVIEYLMVGPQYILIKGSIVNLVLVMGTLLVGLPAGMFISIFTPVLALVTGHLALPVLIPLVTVGNLVLVVIWWMVMRGVQLQQVWWRYGLVIVMSSVLKFAVLYLAVKSYVLPVVLSAQVAKQPQLAKVLLAQFGMPQLITAVIGGSLAVIILPRLRQALDKK